MAVETADHAKDGLGEGDHKERKEHKDRNPGNTGRALHSMRSLWLITAGRRA
jgi:hypothetical protein